TGDRNNQIFAFKSTNTVDSQDPDFLFTEETAIDAYDSSETLQAGIKNYTPAITYPSDTLGKELQMTAQIIAGNLGTQIIYLTLGGFDTHSQQKADQESLLTSLSEGFNAFYSDLVRLNKADNVLVMTFSEF